MALMYLEPDRTVQAVITGLLTTYPHEQIISNGYDCFQKIPPTDTRLTIVAHSHDGSFSNWRPEDLALLLIQQKLPATITTIDIVGCEAGFYKNDTSFAIKLATELANRGRSDIVVKALSNIGYDLELGNMTIVVKCESNRPVHFTALGLANDQEKMRQQTTLEKNMNDCLNIYLKIKSYNKDLKTLIQQKSAVSTQQATQSIIKILTEIQNWGQIINDPNNNSGIKSTLALANDLQQNPLHNAKLQALVSALDDQEQHYNLSYNKLKTEEKSLWITLYETDDIRDTLDRNPNFMFSAKIAKDLAKAQQELEQWKERTSTEDITSSKEKSDGIAAWEQEIKRLEKKLAPGLEYPELRKKLLKEIENQITAIKFQNAHRNMSRFSIFCCRPPMTQHITQIPLLENLQTEIHNSSAPLLEIVKKAQNSSLNSLLSSVLDNINSTISSEQKTLSGPVTLVMR